MDAGNIALAPAAGAGLGKLLFDRLLARDDFLTALEDAIIGGLRATRSYYDKAAGGCVTEPDYRTRIQAAGMTLAQAEGEPIKRVIHQHLGASGEINLQAAVAESPQLQEQLARLLENATWKQSGRKRTKQAEAPKFDPPEMG